MLKLIDIFFVSISVMLAATSVLAATVPTVEQVAAASVRCNLKPDQVVWRVGERQIVAIYVESASSNPADFKRGREAGTCLEAWAATLGLKPVVTVQIPEDH